MKSSVLFLAIVVLSSFQQNQTPEGEVELVCVRKHNASNTCHYNFKVDGINYRYLDMGCKGKKDDLLNKAKNGKLGLAKDWKVECVTPKQSE